MTKWQGCFMAYNFIPRNSKFFNYIDDLIRHEGGVNKKILAWDKGGLTNFGATYNAFTRHLRRFAYHKFYLSNGAWERFHSFDGDGNLFLDVKKYTKKDHIGFLTANDVRFFYFKDYWEVINADSLPRGIDFFMFDFTVHSGQENSVKCLQEIVGVIQDGSIGPKTLNAIEKIIHIYGVVEIERAITQDGQEVMVTEKQFSRVLGVKELLKRLGKRRRKFLTGTKAYRNAPNGMNNRVDKALAVAFNVIGDVYVDDRKPLSQSNTIAAAKSMAKIGSGAIAVGGVIQETNMINNTIDVLPNIIDNLETVETMTKIIVSIKSYGWIIPCVVLLGFAGYLGIERIMKWHRGE